MVLRVYLPALLPEGDGCCLVGWWLTPPDPQGPPSAQALVAAVLDSPSPEAVEERLRGAGGPKRAEPPRVLGLLRSASGAKEASGRAPRAPYLLLSRCGLRGVRIDSVVGVAAAAPAVQLVLYHQPAPRGPVLRYLLGDRQPWWAADADGDGPCEARGLGAARARLDEAAAVAAALASGDAPPALCASLVILGLRLWMCLAVLLGRASALVLRLVALLPGLSRSACVAQCSLRLASQGCRVGLLLSLREGGGETVGDAAGPRAREGRRVALLCSCLLASCDALLGVAVFCLLRRWVTPPALEAVAHVFRRIYGDALVSLVTWLMGAPADFKLNGEFTSFLGGVCISMFSLWEQCVLGHRLGGIHMIREVSNW